MKYKTIYADPPWPERGGGKIKRGADKHYHLMSIKEICAMRPFIDELVHPDGCHLYMWVTNNFFQKGFKVLDAWGFRYTTCITWFKDRAGLGQYYRGITEHCVFAQRGRLPYKIHNGKRMQGVTGFDAKRTEHSRKPEIMREMIERVSYGPYMQLFARREVPGWDVWGNEVGKKETISFL